MQDPAIHIRRSDLITIFNTSEYLRNQDYTIEEIVDKLFRDCYKHTINSRTVVGIRTTNAKRLKNAQTSSKYIAEIVAKAFYMLQYTHGHRNAIHIDANDPNDPQRTVLLKVAELAESFRLKYFEGITDDESAYKTYCRIGFSLMKDSVRINNYIVLDSKINDYQYSQVLIDADTDKKGTNYIYKLWKDRVAQHSPVEIDLTGDPVKFISFLKAKEQADKYKAKYEDWVTAQFDGLEFTGAYPDYYQLHGDNALGRYNKFIYKRNSAAPTNEINKDATVSDSDIKKLFGL